MLKKKDLRCSVYDSLVAVGHKSRTPLRTADRYELELYHTDTGIAHVDDKPYPIRKGMLLCTRPGQRRYSHLPIRCSYIWLPAGSEEGQALETLPSCTYIEDPQVVDTLLRDFTLLHSNLVSAETGPEAKVYRNRLLLEILQICMQQCRATSQPPAADRMIRDACHYMDRHFTENCTLTRVAGHLHISTGYLHTSFLRSTGCTPYEYVTQKRIDKAKKMILMGEASMAQIALETGFCSQSHFGSVFKKATGLTPAQYKKQLFEMK